MLLLVVAACAPAPSPSADAPSVANGPPVVRAITPGLPQFRGCDQGTTTVRLEAGPPASTVDVVVDGVSVAHKTPDAVVGSSRGAVREAGLVEIPCGSNLVVSLRVSGARGKPVSCRLTADTSSATDPDVTASSLGAARCDAVATAAAGAGRYVGPDNGIRPAGRLAGCPAAIQAGGQGYSPLRLDLPSDGDSPTIQEFRLFPNGVEFDDEVNPTSVVRVPCSASSVSYRVQNGAFGRCRIGDGLGRPVVDSQIDDTDCVVSVAG